ncbi:MauE/DoxX family redox-associated membrane protein [Streptosporangium lutulentum]
MAAAGRPGVFAAELAAVVLLAVPTTAVIGFALSAVLLTGFAAGIAGALRRGERTPCRCFGAAGTRLGPAHLVRNLVLAVIAAVGLAVSLSALPRRCSGARRGPGRRLPRGRRSRDPNGRSHHPVRSPSVSSK